MKKRRGLTACALLLLAMSAVAQTSQPTSKPATKPASKPKEERRTVTMVLDHTVMNLEQEFVPAAEAMPEEKYSFAPTQGEFKGVRTFAQQIKHVAAVNFEVAAAILEEKSPQEIGDEAGPASITSKADVLKYLKDSFAYVHKAIASINDKNEVETVKSPFGEYKVSRLGLAVEIPAHGYDHYGQMVEYLRMNGIIPPASK